MSYGLRYAKELLSAAERHAEMGLYGVACFEARQAALSALSYLNAYSSSSVREAYHEVISRGGKRDPEVMYCAAVLDNLYIMTKDACDDACSDELPGGEEAYDATEGDARDAIKCATTILNYVMRSLTR